MSADKKVPEVRFKGFSGAWKNLTLGENAKFTKGQGYSKGDLVTTGAPIILYGRLYTKYQTVITGVDTFVTEKDKSVKSMGGEVIVPASGESPEDISRASVVSEPNVILGGDLNIVLPCKKIHSTFLALAISNGRLKKELSSKAQGKSVVHIRNSDLADLALILPTEHIEQTAIGNYFQRLDKLINQHQQKHDKLSNIKKAMLEKMFPKQDETIPEIRFKGFSGEWVKDKLGQVYNFQYGEFNINPSNGGQYPVYGANGVIGGYTRFNAQNSAVIGHMGEYAGSVLWAEGKHFVTYNGTIAKPKKSDFNPSFGFFSLVKMNLKKVCGGSGQPFLSYDALERLDFTFPSEKEQIAIGNYFQKLDALINQHQQQITKLNNIKQACLSKMFV